MRDGHVLVGGAYAGSIDFGDGPLPGAADEDAFVTKLADGGTAAWSTAFHGMGIQTVYAVVEDSTGVVWAAGSTFGTLEVGNGSLEHSGGGDADAFLIMLSANGQPLGGALFGGFGEQHLTSLGVTDDGTIVVAGSFREFVTATTFGDLVVEGGPWQGMMPLDTFVFRATR
jgi:hypothetical protein